MQHLSNEQGSISLAIIVAIIAIISATSLALIAKTDHAHLGLTISNEQERILLRSEIERCYTVLSNTDTISGMVLPERRVNIKAKNYDRTYYTNSEIKPKTSTAQGVMSYELKCGISNSKGVFNRLRTRVDRYSYAEVGRLNLAGIHYFTDSELTVNNTQACFWGNDVVYGELHTNGDIAVQNGGNNQYNGPWPCFFSKVSMAGDLNWYNGAGPMDQIFRDGYQENAEVIPFPNSADDIRMLGTVIDISGDILYIRSFGASTEGYMGTIVYAGIDTLFNLVPEVGTWTASDGVQNPYQYVRDRSAFNRMTHKDTIWSSCSVTCPNGGGVLIENAQLWIDGTFSGAQTWACTDTLFIAGDILLDGTAMGEFPDDVMHHNDSDRVGLISEESIVIKYGMPDLLAGIDGGIYHRLHPNSDDIYIYAALCALGDGNSNPNYDGRFTFEYQHPHASTPSIGFTEIYDPEMDTVFTKNVAYPDLQGLSNVNGYTPTGYGDIIDYSSSTINNNWPGDLDFPFYNPLYPEGPNDINQYAGERGTIHLFGSVAQRRKGYVHRSNYQNLNRTQNVWMFNDEDFTGIAQYGGNCTSAGEGYDTYYMFDSRFISTPPPLFPLTNKLIFVDHSKMTSSQAGSHADF